MFCGFRLTSPFQIASGRVECECVVISSQPTTLARICIGLRVLQYPESVAHSGFSCVVLSPVFGTQGVMKDCAAKSPRVSSLFAPPLDGFGAAEILCICIYSRWAFGGSAGKVLRIDVRPSEEI